MEYLIGNAWPLSIVADSARSLQNAGRYYFDFLHKISSNMGSYIVSGLCIPGNLFGMFEQDFNSITSTASFRILNLTIHNIVYSIIPFLRGEGPVFNLNEDNPLIRALHFCLRILYYVSMIIAIFILPTFFISIFILGIIYLNFGYGIAVISAGCIVSFTIINLAIQFCLTKQTIQDPSNQKNAEAIKVSLTH
ncbi:unnamed protein product [Rodentolepis nana]|uniref:Multi antimicrobial extrusion protein n=1 Tax=Rodentolepis nana TaxID=102285 RepID=A0A0R3TG71_RODNA|nr:unnamed protein product [Rodentolepis nana]